MLLGQSVLLAGVNDTVAALEDLFRTMLRHRVKPYYLHQLDPAPGTARFHVPQEQGLALIAALRGRVPGYAIPQYVVERPGGRGKVPVGADRADVFGHERTGVNGGARGAGLWITAWPLPRGGRCVRGRNKAEVWANPTAACTVAGLFPCRLVPVAWATQQQEQGAAPGCAGTPALVIGPPLHPHSGPLPMAKMQANQMRAGMVIEFEGQRYTILKQTS